MIPPSAPVKLTRADLARHPHLAAIINPAAPATATTKQHQAPPAAAPPGPGISRTERFEILAHGAMIGMVAAGVMRIMLGVWT